MNDKHLNRLHVFSKETHERGNRSKYIISEDDKRVLLIDKSSKTTARAMINMYNKAYWFNNEMLSIEWLKEDCYDKYEIQYR